MGTITTWRMDRNMPHTSTATPVCRNRYVIAGVRTGAMTRLPLSGCKS